MPKVTFLPVDMTVEGNEGESILDVALNHDVPIQHSCGGFCACTTCQVVVTCNPEQLSPKQDDEQDLLENVAINESSRLACQAKLKKADVTVQIVNLE